MNRGKCIWLRHHVSLHIHRQKPNYLEQPGKWKPNPTRRIETRRKSIGSSINLQFGTNLSDPVTMWQTAFPAEAWPQKPNGHNFPGQTYLLSLSSLKGKVDKGTSERKNVLRVLCICHCAVGIGVTCYIEMGLDGWVRGAAEERRMRGMKMRQTTQNFFLLNFNLLDKNNSKWGTEYAWGREGILSFSGDSSLNGIANYVSHCSVQFS